MSLKEELKKLNSNSDAKEIFENREKGDLKDLFGKVFTLRNFGIFTNEEYGEYIGFIVDEFKDKYFLNGGQVMIEKFKQAEAFKNEIKQEGAEIKLIRVKSVKHKNREYTDILFYPDESNLDEFDGVDLDNIPF